MDRFEAMRVFIAVAEAEGFAPAARRLHLSPPAVTRAVAALEQRIGSRLLQRSTRQVRLTEAGARFLADARHILAELDEAEASAAGAHAVPSGQLGVTAPVLFGRAYVAPVLFNFLAAQPAVTARSMFVDRVVDLMDEGFDVAVRIAHLPDSSLSALRVGSVRHVVCAAPAFLERHGRPRQPADLETMPAISFSPDLGPADWAFGAGDARVRVKPRTAIEVNVGDVAIAAAVAGHGVVRLLSYQVADALRLGRLVRVLEAHEPPPVPIQIVHRDGRQASAKVRAFVDFAAKLLRQNPAVNPDRAGLKRHG